MDLRRYHARLRLLPCAVCVALGESPRQCAELHHVGDPGTERNGWSVVPLCQNHHQGPEGIHGLHRRGFVKKSKLSDVTLLAITNKLYHGEMP